MHYKETIVKNIQFSARNERISHSPVIRLIGYIFESDMPLYTLRGTKNHAPLRKVKYANNSLR